jgi:hypothetical protein
VFLLLSAYRFSVGILEQLPIGLSYPSELISLSLFPLRSNTYREGWVVSQRCVQGIANSKIDRDLIQIMFQDDEAENHVNDTNSDLRSARATYPVGREVALPRIASNVLNDCVELTNPPATLQSINRINYRP